MLIILLWLKKILSRDILFLSNCKGSLQADATVLSFRRTQMKVNRICINIQDIKHLLQLAFLQSWALPFFRVGFNRSALPTLGRIAFWHRMVKESRTPHWTVWSQSIQSGTSYTSGYKNLDRKGHNFKSASSFSALLHLTRMWISPLTVIPILCKHQCTLVVSRNLTQIELVQSVSWVDKMYIVSFPMSVSLLIFLKMRNPF